VKAGWLLLVCVMAPQAAQAQLLAMSSVSGGYFAVGQSRGFGGAIDVTTPIVRFESHTALETGVAISFVHAGSACARANFGQAAALARLRKVVTSSGAQVFAGAQAGFISPMSNDCVTFASFHESSGSAYNTTHLAFGIDGGIELPIFGRNRLLVAASIVRQRVDWPHSWIRGLRVGFAMPIR
jgi:hypothetical protein